MTMTPAQARDAVEAALAEIAPEIDPSSSGAVPLGAGLDLDSMDLLALLAGIERLIGSSIPDSAVRSEWTLDDLIAFVATR